MNKIAKQFYEEGLISKEAAEQLDQFDQLIKEAGFLDNLKDIIISTAKKVGPSALGTTIGIAGADYLTSRHRIKQQENELARLQSSFNTITTQDDELGNNREKASTRFNEIAHFSPTVAKHPAIAKPLVKRTLHTGLDEKDVRTLVQIEAGQAQVRSVPGSVPTSARIVQNVVPGAVKSFGDEMVQTFGNPDVKEELKMKQIPPEKYEDVIVMLIDNNAMPPELSDITVNDVRGGNVEAFNRINEASQKDPELFKKQAIKHRLSDKWNNIAGFAKSASINYENILEGVSLEKRAQILADQYCLIKHAGLGDMLAKNPGLKSALFGLGAAALFGSVGAVAEEMSDYKRSQQMNERIQESWGDTKKTLKSMAEEGVAAVQSPETDYTNKEVMNKAEKAFKALAEVAPNVAANPTTALPFVNQVVMNDGFMDANLLKTVTEAQRNINTSKQYRSPYADSPLAQGFGRGFESAGGKEFIKGIAKS